MNKFSGSGVHSSAASDAEASAALIPAVDAVLNDDRTLLSCAFKLSARLS